MSFFDGTQPFPTPDSTKPGMADGSTDITILNLYPDGMKILRQA